MQKFTGLSRPEVLEITDQSGRKYYGGDQAWYRSFWKRQSGCGPTSCSNLIWYLAITREKYKVLFQGTTKTKSEFICLMEQVWKYVTPTLQGVHKVEIFTDGAVRFAKGQNVVLSYKKLVIPQNEYERPGIEGMDGFLTESLAKDRPVAFLNLSNGKIKHLESWHWVTIVGYRMDTHTALIYDQGRTIEADMKLWLETTYAGGGFVSLY